MIEQLDGMLGGLSKMAIAPWGSGAALLAEDAFYLMFNPEQYQEALEVNYDSTKSEYQRRNPTLTKKKNRQFHFDFIIDGTGASGVKIDVESKITAFKALVAEGEDPTKTNYLRLQWGTLHMKCLFKGANITYTYFSRTGLPLRARLSTDFEEVETRSASLLAQAEQAVSKVVGAGQNIAALTAQAYGTANKMAQLAQANNLNSFRDLPVGTNLLYPKQADL